MENKDLAPLRRILDGIDDQLLALFLQRMQTVEQIAAVKRREGLPVLAAAREQALLARLTAEAPEAMQPYTRAFFASLLSLSRGYQTALAEQSLRCGLIGRRLGHSYSPAIHARLAGYAYRLIELEPAELEPFLKRGEFDGLNVTIPYKKTVLPCCDELTETARRCGSVNTLRRRPDGTLVGHNTDYEGFLWLLSRLGTAVEGKKALVLGSGGASAAVCAALRERGAGAVVTVSRNGENNYVNLYERHADAALLVNATPVGMAPETGLSLVDLEKLPVLEGVIDLVYNPAKTRLLLDAERLSIPCANGLGMLVAQAAASCSFFTGRSFAADAIEAIAAAIEKETKNLLLIGMPGSGKSTVGAALAAALGRPFADSDALVAERAGRDVPAIFTEEGETGFREREHAALKELTRQSGLVIAVGGGAVTRADNLDLLRQNSTVIWLRRELSALAVDGRPLSRERGVEQLYAAREPLYRAAAELVADNNGSVDDCVKRILEALT